MYRAKCYLKSISPVSFSRRFEDKRPDTEDPEEYEKKTWREKAHYNGDGEVIIPAEMFKKALVNAAKIRAENIPGKGNATYTSRMKAGVIVENDIPLGIKKDQLECQGVFVDSQGGRGGTQVYRLFPIVREWEGVLNVLVTLDEIIRKDVFEKYIRLAGMIAGVGRYRPERGGKYGRFKVEKIEYEDIED